MLKSTVQLRGATESGLVLHCQHKNIDYSCSKLSYNKNWIQEKEPYTEVNVFQHSITCSIYILAGPAPIMLCFLRASSIPCSHSSSFVSLFFCLCLCVKVTAMVVFALICRGTTGTPEYSPLDSQFIAEPTNCPLHLSVWLALAHLYNPFLFCFFNMVVGLISWKKNYKYI